MAYDFTVHFFENVKFRRARVDRRTRHRVAGLDRLDAPGDQLKKIQPKMPLNHMQA
jgi:hypothetical protein